MVFLLLFQTSNVFDYNRFSFYFFFTLSTVEPVHCSSEYESYNNHNNWVSIKYVFNKHKNGFSYSIIIEIFNFHSCVCVCLCFQKWKIRAWAPWILKMVNIRLRKRDSNLYSLTLQYSGWKCGVCTNSSRYSSICWVFLVQEGNQEIITILWKSTNVKTVLSFIIFKSLNQLQLYVRVLH